MKKKRLVTRTIILAVLALAVGYTLYANMNKDKNQKIEVGKPAPDFVLVDMEGNKHRLSEYKGQGVFVNFWATWCKPCEREMPYIENQYQQFKDQGVQVLAIDSSESELVVNKFVERKGLNFPVLIDKDGQVQAAYGINPLPITFLIDKEGNVVKSHTGELTEETVREFMEQIKP
ncbi:thiol-disulfide oxidoreductase ResA [Mesobacillus subterraneus]|uniref:thiol-disulfide oxidoreductase ResA n=1 Tax=Mesobacillus subterraneus TaxID=285983 RepID=UPI00203B6B5C|nr:thiol-disulfide oxidoreductase ResA [Mesobacillus subterraneus]MCM3665340.1 thiol-disulfide oxidoreductase ResA [Mesobacillus subterraneus]MCM3684652.1 thiol-disulfide oxidoreductase ResA [Mesobacillus subterraneus]